MPGRHSSLALLITICHSGHVKDESGRWQGINLTYYGLLTANAAVVAVALLCILMTAIGVPTIGILAVMVAEILVCLFLFDRSTVTGAEISFHVIYDRI